jgi:hypothetical protein
MQDQTVAVVAGLHGTKEPHLTTMMSFTLQYYTLTTLEYHRHRAAASDASQLLVHRGLGLSQSVPCALLGRHCIPSAPSVLAIVTCSRVGQLTIPTAMATSMKEVSWHTTSKGHPEVIAGQNTWRGNVG